MLVVPEQKRRWVLSIERCGGLPISGGSLIQLVGVGGGPLGRFPSHEGRSDAQTPACSLERWFHTVPPIWPARAFPLDPKEDGATCGVFSQTMCVCDM